MNLRTLSGAILVLLGASLYLHHGAALGTGQLFAYFWPSLFVIPLGIFFHWLYFSAYRRGVGLLVPGGILFVSGLVCQTAMLFNNWDKMWPGFIFAAAFGLFELYWFGSRNKWLLIPINILVVLSGLFSALFTLGSLYNHLLPGRLLPAACLIVAGVLLLLGRKKEPFA